MTDGLPQPRRRVAYIALALGVTMAVLDGTIANVALPTIGRDLHVSPAESIWVVNAFQLAVTASLLAFAALGERRGPTRVYRIGVWLFLAGSLACALARSFPLLIAARVVQGLGASAAMAISPAILRDIFPRAQLGRALGLNALVVATSAAAGPTLGGLVLSIAPWPWLFAINVPFGIANLALNRALPDDERSGEPLDIPSVVASALGFALTIWGLDGIARHEPAWTIFARVAAGIASAWWFVRRQGLLPSPMIALDLFRIPAFSIAAATSLATFTAQGLAFVVLPFVFQEARGASPLVSGLLLTSWPLAIAVVAPFAGRLSDRFAPPLLATVGLAVLTLGLGLYAMMPPHAAAAEIVLHGALCGLGFGFFQSPNNRELIGSAPREKSASASGLLAAVRVSGQTIGAAMVAIVFGAFGASIAGGGPGQIVAHAAAPTLWLACGCAAAGTIASALRLRRPGLR